MKQARYYAYMQICLCAKNASCKFYYSLPSRLVASVLKAHFDFFIMLFIFLLLKLQYFKIVVLVLSTLHGGAKWKQWDGANWNQRVFMIDIGCMRKTSMHACNIFGMKRRDIYMWIKSCLVRSEDSTTKKKEAKNTQQI